MRLNAFLLTSLKLHTVQTQKILSPCLTFRSNTCDIFIDKLPSEYEANPELLFYRITHLNHRQQYLIWASAVTTAGRGNFSDKVTVEPAAKGKFPVCDSFLQCKYVVHEGRDPGCLHL